MDDASLAPRTRPRRIGFSPLGVGLMATLVAVPVASSLLGGGAWYPLLSLLLDGAPAVFILLAGGGLGLWLVPLFRLRRMPLRWHLLAGSALGIGALALLTLALGLVGVLNRGLCVALLTAALVAGWLRLRRLLVDHRISPNPGTPSPGIYAGGSFTRLSERSATELAQGMQPLSASAGPLRWLSLLIVPFAVLAILAAVNAPGLLWGEEGWAYDALEYHLQMPKEYLHVGRVHYAPHNVYANFPANVEMLYLLGMIVMDSDVDAGVCAHFIHLLLGALTVFAAWVAGREASPRVGVLAAVAMGTTGWMAYLAGLAYVENGLLFFGATAVASLLRAVSHEPSSSRDAEAERRDAPAMPWLVLSGVAAGLACGCKYTAVPMIAFPLALASTMVPVARPGQRWRNVLATSAAALVAFLPWLAKNQAMTGNPLFPLANGLFRAYPEGWGQPESDRWDEAHRARPHERSFAARLELAWHHFLADRYQRIGPMLLLLGLAGLATRRLDRSDAVLALVFLLQFLIWLLATHLMARFAVVVLIPLSILAGRTLWPPEGAPGSPNPRRVRRVVGLAAVGSLFNLGFVIERHILESPHGVPPSLIYERLDEPVPAGDAREYLHYVNHELSADAHILLIGDVRPFYLRRDVDYCVVFNRNPFVEVLRQAADPVDVAAWLRGHGYSHVMVHWAEIARLRRSYGFAPEVSPQTFEALAPFGITLEREFTFPEYRGRYISLFRVQAS